MVKAKMMRLALSSILALASATMLSDAAMAAPSGTAQMSGTAQAKVIIPGSVVPLRDLRFGQMMQPSAAGTVTIAQNSTASALGGMIGNIGIPQIGTGRGSGAFTLTGTPGRMFLLTLPNLATISSGAQTMRVTNFNANTGLGGVGFLNAAGTYVLNVGARLNVGSNQAIGSYAGTYNITVIFL